MLKQVVRLLLASLAISGCHAAIGPVANMNIVNQVIQPDGFKRSAVLAGGTFPGPLIKGNTGDIFSLNVTNSLTDPTMFRSTSVHWHGLLQAHSNYGDGVAFVTQCPIVPEHSFLYNYRTLGQAGTFWYHSHLSTQYCDGLRGPLVIYDPYDPHKSLYDVDDESTVITLSDWYHTPAPEAGPFPFPDSILINGLGRYQGGPSDSPLTVVNVQHGKRYRMRLISMACHPVFSFTIDGHNMTIIEADGISTQPVTVDFISILAGQRYSFILEAKQPINNYWIRSDTNLGPGGFAGGINSAILRYVGANISDPTTTQTPSVIPLMETDLHALDNTPVPGIHEVGGADVNLRFDLGFNGANFTVNGTAFVDPKIPVLLQILSGARKATDLLPQGSVYTLPPNKVIDLIIPGGVAGSPHPFHLHGHAFDVIRSAGSNATNFKNPVRRDTVSLGVAGDEVIIRFVTDNSGPWFFHCHVDWHLNAGLAIIFAEDSDGTAAHSPVTPAWNELCPTYQALNPDHF